MLNFYFCGNIVLIVYLSCQRHRHRTNLLVFPGTKVDLCYLPVGRSCGAPKRPFNSRWDHADDNTRTLVFHSSIAENRTNIVIWDIMTLVSGDSLCFTIRRILTWNANNVWDMMATRLSSSQQSGESRSARMVDPLHAEGLLVYVFGALAFLMSVWSLSRLLPLRSKLVE